VEKEKGSKKILAAFPASDPPQQPFKPVDGVF